MEQPENARRQIHTPGLPTLLVIRISESISELFAKLTHPCPGRGYVPCLDWAYLSWRNPTLVSDNGTKTRQAMFAVSLQLVDIIALNEQNKMENRASSVFLLLVSSA
mmetsp:Transcript_35297/g.57098  ORF Transcript_35297/g.57098 Transcript_35297/m.57098 type:complete len:107 (+) Transcript_35297:219-539(+)